MPLALLPYPRFDPVLLKIGPFSIGSLTLGPFSIRWYALAYIFGILLGWLYARRIIVKERLWGGRLRAANSAKLIRESARFSSSVSPLCFVEVPFSICTA